MKKIFLSILLLSACCLSAQNYHIPNGNFEQWESSDISAEPLHWNSFATSDGSFSSMASSPHHYHRYGGRPGSSGSSFLTIYTKSVIGIKANGNMTTGRIHAGSMAAASSENYNYTLRSNPDFALPIQGTPDSLVLWVSYYAAEADSKASVQAVLHGDCDFRDPADNTNAQLFAATANCQFSRTSSSPSSYSWTRLSIPFDYSGNASPAYLLISLTTNAIPGAGNANDSLSVDDIQLVYSASLSDITLNGSSISGYQLSNHSFFIPCDPSQIDSYIHQLDFHTLVDDAEVSLFEDYFYPESSEQYTSALVTALVTAEDGVTQQSYFVGLGSEMPPVSISAPSAPRVSVFPNPASDCLIISSAAPLLSIVLCDLQGHQLLVSQPEGSLSFSLSLSSIPRGIYIARIITSQGQTTQKVVKQ